MGEVVVTNHTTSSSNSEELLEIISETELLRRKMNKEEELVKKRKREGEGINGLIKWEKLLPKMVLSVLLVEADDSTRQIITALLKKCSYRVAAVPDGLKAWEMLKGRPHDIDLILTEVDLPSISGYALLTLIMEHEVCKNIPVIMMSTQDSISTVYKCMLRGAADYLVKPIRRNELRNLWQHVWRRQSSLVGGNVPPDESVGQDKVEATSENNAASNHSSGNIARIQRSKEYVEKGSDAQSSCTKPDVEAESTHMENAQDLTQSVWGKFPFNDPKMQNQDMHTFCQKRTTHDGETGGLSMAAYKDSITMTMDKDVETQSQRVDTNITSEACDNNDVLVSSSRTAIDFMGTDHNSSSSYVKSKFDTSPPLDLSLRRSHPFGFNVQVSEDRHTLRHSDASAFTRYNNGSSRPPHSTLSSIYNNTQLGASLEGRLSSNIGSYNSDTPGSVPFGQRTIISLATGQSKESKIAIPCPQRRVFPIQIPVEGIRFSNLCTGYGSAYPSVLCKQSDATPTLSPSSASQPEATFKGTPFHQSDLYGNCEPLYDRVGQNANDSTNQIMQNHENKLGALEDQERISPTTDQSASSSFCNGAVSHLNSIGYGSTSGSNSNVDQVGIVRTAAESQKEDVIFAHNANSHRSTQREAALNKFRLKRKDRCYEKKVRYESRKKLAEQRPRVKGQFVRQVHTDPLHSETK